MHSDRSGNRLMSFNIESLKSSLIMGLLVLSVAMLGACDDDGSNSLAQRPDPNSQSTSSTSLPSPSLLSQEQQIRQYQNTDFRILDIGEREWKGKGSLGIVLSVPVDIEQDLQPWLRVESAQGDAVPGSWVPSDDNKTLYFTNTKPKARYRVRVENGLPALTGKSLKEGFTQIVNTRKLEPGVSFASRGSVLPAGLTSGIPLNVVNVPEVQINFHRLDPKYIDNYFRTGRNSYNRRFNRYDLLSQWGELVYSGRFSLDAPADTRVKRSIDVEGIKALQKPGLYVAVLDEPGTYDYRRDITHFVVTDIGLHVRMYEGQMQVVVSSLANAGPVSGVTLTLRDNQGHEMASNISDGEGMANFPLTFDKLSYLLASHGEHIAVLELTGPAIDLSEFDLGQRPQVPQQAFIYTPRDLFRPGETVDFNILLRNGDGYLTAPLNLNIHIRKPDGQVVQQTVLRPREKGYYHWSFVIPGNSATGNWTFDITNLASGMESYRFKVEEFLPERMTLEFNDGKQEPMVHPVRTPLRIPVEGQYLYGAPASGNRLSNKVQVSLARQPLPEFKGYFFGNELEKVADSKLDLPDQFLDESGRSILDLGARWQAAQSPLQVNITSSLYESGGRPVVRHFPVTLLPNGPLIGVKPSFADKSPDANSEVQFDLMMLDTQHKPSTKATLDVRLIREDRQYFWTYDEEKGWHYDVTEREYELSAQQVAITEEGENRVQLPVEWGHYRLEVKDQDSGALTNVRFHAGEDWYAWWRENEKADASLRPDAVTLALDKRAYQGGDTARLKINSPHTGDALVMVESEKPLWTRRITLGEREHTLDIPVSPEWNQHDLYVSVIVLRPADGKQNITPNRAFGLVHLPLDRSTRALTLTVDAPEKTVPEVALPTTIQVKDAQGQPFADGYVSLAAVDVGVLNVSQFETPDPLEGFFGRRRYGVDSRDVYGDIIEVNQYDKAALRFGGDAQLSRGGKEAQADVQIVSLFNEPVRLDGQGKAQVVLPLPYFNGRLRLMALAFGDSRFGSTEQEMTLAAPVVTQLSMPRFLALGDQSEVALDLNNLSGVDQDLKVTIKTSGGLRFGEKVHDLSVQNNHKQTLRVPVLAKSMDTGKVSIVVEGEGFEPIRREWNLSMRAAYPAELRGKNQILKPGESLTLPPAFLEGVHEQSAELLISLSNRANLNVPKWVGNLLQYPYGCLEQTSSRAYPLVYADDEMQRLFNMNPVSAILRKQQVEAALTHLAGMQLSNGGFGLWSNNAPEELWLTAYVADFMVNAEEQGFAVPKPMMDKALNRLQQYVQHTGGLFSKRYTRNSDHDRFAYQSYAAYVLSRYQRVPLSSLRILHDRYRQQARSGLPLLQLGLALQAAGDLLRSQQAINEALLIERDANEYLGDYGSPIRDQAVMIYLLLKHQQFEDKALELSYSLADEIAGRQWLSTQESNALFLAGMELEQVSGKTWSAEWVQGPGQGGNANSEKRSLQQNSNFYQKQEGVYIQLPFTVRNTGDERVRIAASLSAYPRQTPKPMANGYQVERHYYDVDSNPVADLAKHKINTGDLLLVHVRLHSDEHTQDSMVVDLLPAGFELENQNLEHAFKLDQFSVDGHSLKDLMQQNKLTHQEFRDDRYVAVLETNRSASHLLYVMRAVTPGTYQVPPTLVEDMYRVQYRAIGDAVDSVVVLPR